MSSCYWDNTGKYQEQFDRLLTLVGSSPSVAGELTKAANRIGYEFWNNGFCNNVSYAYSYLVSHNAISDNSAKALEEHCRGKCYNGKYNGDSTELAVNQLIDDVMLHIQKHPELETLPNTASMLDSVMLDDYEYRVCDCGFELDKDDDECPVCCEDAA